MVVNNACSFLLAGLLGISFSIWDSVTPTLVRTASTSPTPTPTPAAVIDQEQDDEQSRQIVATEFLNTRPPKKGKIRISPPPTAPPKAQTLSSGLLGVTVWRLRPVGSGDSGARILEHKADSETELIPERVPSSTRFVKGQKVRLSIESPRSGYLYVLDREEYADGTYGDSNLIFPTLTIKAGDNAVTAGRLIELPDQDDQPSYFKMNPHRADQTGEVLTFLITSQPLPNLRLRRDYLKLTNEQVSQWEQKWKGPTRRVDLASRAGETYTNVEKTAGANRASLLNDDDPPPQTIYRVIMRSADGMMVVLRLQYETLAPPKSNRETP